MASVAAKVKPTNSNQAGPSSSKPLIKKKIEPSSKSQAVVGTKNKSFQVKTPKSEEKGKTTTPTTPVTKSKREKKVYSLPGQKYDIPEEREPLRIFYESLSQQIPTSEMAEFWLMEHGMLSPERAKKAYEKKQRKQKQLRTGTPIKSPPPPPSRPESSNKQKALASKYGNVKAKRRIAVDSSDDEFIGKPQKKRAIR